MIAKAFAGRTDTLAKDYQPLATIERITTREQAVSIGKATFEGAGLTLVYRRAVKFFLKL